MCLKIITGILFLCMCTFLQVCSVFAADETDSAQNTQDTEWNTAVKVRTEQGAFTFEGVSVKR